MLTRLRLAWRLYRDPRVAPRLKFALPIIAVLYVLSPVDLVPDFLLGVGQLDDLTVVALMFVMLGKLARWAPAAVVEQHLAGLIRKPGPTASNPDGPAQRTSDVVDVTYRVVESREKNRAAG